MSRSQFEPLVREKAAKYGLDPEIIVRQVTIESNWNPTARSSSDARGLMQLMQRYYGQLGDLFDPELNVETGCRLMRGYLDRWGGDYARALASYNAGQAAMERWIGEFGDDWRLALSTRRWRWLPVAGYGDSTKADQVRRYLDKILDLEQYAVEEATMDRPPANRHLSPNHDGPRARTTGIVIHSTRGNAVNRTAEHLSTINWFQNHASLVSAHLVIGDLATTQILEDDVRGWHALELNDDHLGIELVQRFDGEPYSDRQYAECAKWCVYWSKRYGFPAVRVLDQKKPGLIGHEDAQAGKRLGKSDPGKAFDWARLAREIAAVQAPVPNPFVRLPVDVVSTLGNDLTGKGHELQKYAEYFTDASAAIVRYPEIEGVNIANRLAELGRELREIPGWLSVQVLEE